MKTNICMIMISASAIILSAGCSKYFFVDKANIDGPWMGTAKYPYKTIQEGLNATREGLGDVVWVKSGVYLENVTMKRGTKLYHSTGSITSLIQGSASHPTVVTKGGNRIRGFTIEGGTAGIQLDLGSALAGNPATYNYFTDCEIKSPQGVVVKTPSNLTFGNGVRKTAKVHIADNWFRPTVKGGTGIDVALTGPKTGKLSISLKVKDNVLQEQFTGISVEATGQGPNPGGKVRAQVIGYIENNLIIKNAGTGIRLYSKNFASAAPAIFNNTIADNGLHGVLGEADSGPDGDGSTHPMVTNNIITGNKGLGYYESGPKTSAADLTHNLFFQNSQGHYYDHDTDKFIYSEAELNKPIVNKKVVFYCGLGNIVADPKYAAGAFWWKGMNHSIDPASKFFLSQGKSVKSPAVDSGFGSAANAELDNRTTRMDFAFDTGTVDRGFHYRKP